MSRTDHHRPWQIRAEDLSDLHTGLIYWSCRLGGWNIRHVSLSQPPRWYVNHVWNGPERQRERDGLRAMAQEYNEFGQLMDEDFPNYRHRHMAAWLWA